MERARYHHEKSHKQQKEEERLMVSDLKLKLLAAGVRKEDIRLRSTWLGNGQPKVNGCYPGTDYEDTLITYKGVLNISWLNGEDYHLTAHGWYAKVVQGSDIQKVIELVMTFEDDLKWYNKNKFWPANDN